MDVELAMHREILARSLDLIRKGPTLTVSELSLLSGCAESVIDACVQELLDCGLIAEDGSHPTLQPRALTFRHDSGTILVAELGASRTSVGATDLAGQK